MFGHLLGLEITYIHFRGLLIPKEFCQVQNSLCIQVLRSPILAALLYGTRVVGISQTLRHGTRNEIMQLLPRVIFNRGPLQHAELWPSNGWDPFGSLATPANFVGFHVLVALLHATLVVGVSQTLWHWTEGATYIRQGGHHVGHWPTF